MRVNIRSAAGAGAEQHQRAVRQFAGPAKRTHEGNHQRVCCKHDDEHPGAGFEEGPGRLARHLAGSSPALRITQRCRAAQVRGGRALMTELLAIVGILERSS